MQIMRKTVLIIFLVLLNLCIGLITKAANNAGSFGTSAFPSSQFSTSSSLIHGPAVACVNQTGVVFSVDSIPNMTNYTWTVPPGATISGGQGTRSIQVSFASNFGSVCVTADDGVNTSGPYCSLVSYAGARPAQPTAINGPTTTVCPGNIVTYTVNPDPIATSYSWVLPSRMTIIDGAGTDSITVRVDTGFVWGYLRVAATNCRGNSGLYAIAVFSAPAKPGSVTGPSVGACPGGTYTYSFAPVPGATSYTWYAPPGCVVTSPAASGNPLTTSVTTVDITFPANFGSGQLNICSNSGCNSSELREMKIRALPVKPGAIWGPFYGVCSMTNIQYTLDSVPGATSYTWSFTPSNSTVIHDNGNDTITVDFLPGYTHATLCVAANNTCGSSISRCGVVFASPRIPIGITGPNGACNTIPSAAIAYYSVAPVFGADSYQWSIPPGAMIANGAGTNSITVNYLGATSGNVSCAAINTCGVSPARYHAIVVNPCRIASNGSVEYLPQAQLFPNPAKDHATLQFFAPEAERYTISITDLTGRRLTTFDRISAGDNTEYIELSDYPKGLYMIELRRKDMIDNIKMIVD